MPDDVKTQDYMPSYSPYTTEPLDTMYPDIYYHVYPTVKQYSEMYDNPNNPGFYPYPTRVAVEQMTTQIYQKVTMVTGPLERKDDRGLLRPLILILVIRELLRRRGSF